MKSLEFVLKNFKSNCIDSRDAYRLGEYTPKSKLLGLKLKDGETHTPKEWCEENILHDLKDDIRFGYTKAINSRGISSAFMASVVEMWDWILTDDKELLEHHDSFCDNHLNVFMRLATKYGISLEEME
ncbi:hypothetical protein [Lactobacillus sp. UCMA15818]|uniref:hypothetical protein n=1 Tax=Lactobacillus sp. UCMA15818 TaxID=2583394 RepID=UPI0025B1CAC3|nr:hypothetical protein [Lactobacillus sp. UCMA15818]MDN2452551.1 hypothetical protein [Lactobacillus sp. UCMA15818]